METFGRHLLQFAHSVDIVSETVILQTRNMVTDYLQSCLDIKFWEILTPITIDGKPGLKTEWSLTAETEWAQTLRDAQNNFYGQISYAWEKRRPLVWIVGQDPRATLKRSKSYKDLLYEHDSAEIPKYVSLTDQAIRTSIMAMIPHDRYNIGIINMESGRYLKPSDDLRKELNNIREAVGMLMGLYKTYLVQNKSTAAAIKSLGQFKLAPLRIDPKAFFSFAQNADREVTDAISEAFEPYDVELQNWQKDDNPGNINEQIWENISKSEFGICYLSEFSKDKTKSKFKDNYNVIFEVGLMHCLTKLEKMRKYILIRERDSPPAPFNFNAEKIVFVPRNSSGELNVGALIKKVQSVIDQLDIPKKD